MADLTYTEGDAECALCVWEEMLRLRNTEDSDNAKALLQTWEQHGTSAMRFAAIDVGVWIEGLFTKVEGDDPLQDLCDEHQLDWDIVPAIVGMIEWGDGGIWTKPTGTPAEIAARVAEALKPKEKV